MILRDILLFFLIQIAYAAFAHAEAYMEGKEGWKWNSSWWHIPLPGGYTYTAYHVYMYVFTLFILTIILPLVVNGWEWHLFYVLGFSWCIGSNLADFLWFVVNPLYPLSKWNPKDTRWYPWITKGSFHIPRAYVIRFAIAVLLLFPILRDWTMI
ncbi:hypothetical protein A2971_03505 [Candidatus Gottesmanbacteria bacterium RIFCSPLOWO2_01_FULL_46_21]|uniref:Uncharacterized protein n=1 Tax=Candidatus Gottesmanbacteria bacterium RIFCSPLOWO2_01_FULL_46_21 TaxID=1798393 RepID=A0A1F6AYT9_9BACT|nr:MAG: hypothetical protein A2971_03505 [Candidatus Gottesmanbacteria bacterium RIFCSPLOWO2_01_FULL_46_21]